MKKEKFLKVKDGLKKCPAASGLGTCQKCPYHELGPRCSETLIKDAGKIIDEMMTEFNISADNFS